MGTSWQDRVVTVDGHRLHLRRAGPDTGGDPLLVLHDAGAESVDAPAWAELAGRRPVVQLLLPGIGDSAAVPPGAGLAWMTDLLAALVTAPAAGLAPGPVDVAGTSLGGWFAVETALAHPRVVRSLLLLDTAGLHSPPAYLFGLFADGQGTGGHDGLLGPLMRRHGLDPSCVPATAPYVATMTAAALHSWSAHAPDPSLLVRLGRLQVPVTVMWGARDALIPVAHGRAIAQACPGGARLVVVEGAGHLLAVEAPAQVVAEMAGRSRRGVLPSGPPCP